MRETCEFCGRARHEGTCALQPAAKRRWDLLPWDGLGHVVDVLTDGVELHADGAEKHGAEKYRERSAEYHRERLARHMGEYLSGQRVDPDTKRRTLAHVAARALMLLAVESQ